MWYENLFVFSDFSSLSFFPFLSCGVYSVRINYSDRGKGSPTIDALAVSECHDKFQRVLKCKYSFILLSHLNSLLKIKVFPAAWIFAPPQKRGSANVNRGQIRLRRT
jgi:hypothetical protein